MVIQHSITQAVNILLPMDMIKLQKPFIYFKVVIGMGVENVIQKIKLNITKLWNKLIYIK